MVIEMMESIVVNIKLWGVVAGIALGLLVLLLIGGSLLESALKENHPAYNTMTKVMIISAFSLIFVLATSLWPLIFQVILYFQQSLGTNGAFLSVLTRIRVPLILVMWGLQLIGLLIALPYLLKIGFFRGNLP